MFSLVLAVVRTSQYAWDAPQTLVPLALAASQRRAAQPLVRLGILRDRPLAIACLVIFCIAAAQFAAFYFASLYLQNILGYSPVGTGLAFVPFSLGVIVGTMAAGRLVPRLGTRDPLLAGLVMAAGGIAWFGLGLCFVTIAATATSSVAPDEAGLASGLINACRQCGGSVGLAVLVTVANTATRDRAASGPAVPSAVTAGYDHAFLVAGALIAVSAAATAVFLRPRTTAVPYSRIKPTCRLQ